jgi:molybdate transport system substrate-binding protein
MIDVRMRTALGLVAAAPLIVAEGCRGHEAPSAAPLRVAAAADLAFAFRELGDLYEKAARRKVVLSFGSTGLLEKQIAEGAPYDVFAAANVAFADDAIASGACVESSKMLYATGRIVLFASSGSPFAPRSVADLSDARVKRIAIANPEHAPYGRAARQAMQRAGVWEKVGPKLVYGENVQQALQFALSGNADVALVALSLATVTPGQWTPVPPELYDRIDQALVVCTRGSAGTEEGRRFTAFVGSADGRSVMRRYGFVLPGESMAEAKPGNTDR